MKTINQKKDKNEKQKRGKTIYKTKKFLYSLKNQKKLFSLKNKNIPL
jgi:hypothetical protein